jgi:hypothetical protein
MKTWTATPLWEFGILASSAVSLPNEHLIQSEPANVDFIRVAYFHSSIQSNQQSASAFAER